MTKKSAVLRPLSSNKLKSVWIREIEIQCSMASYAYEQLEKVPLSPSFIRQKFFYIYGFLTHVGNIAQFLTSDCGPNAHLRFEFLKQVLAPSPIIDRAFRNILQHYDANVLEWLERTRN